MARFPRPAAVIWVNLATSLHCDLSDGDEAYFVFTSASWVRPPCTMCPEQPPTLPLVLKNNSRAARGGEEGRGEEGRKGGRVGH